MDQCEWCPGGFWDCGPNGTRCQQWNDPDEDRCHYLWVLIRKKDGCCQAKLWLPGAGPPPQGWTKYEKVPIRIATNEIKNECVARIYVPDVDCKEYDVRCDDDENADRTSEAKIHTDQVDGV